MRILNRILANAAGLIDLEQAALRIILKLVVVETSSFGTDGPWKDYLAPDLIAGALGGAVATTGDVDTPPLKTFGELNFMVSGVYVAIAALAAWLNQAAENGQGQRVGVSVHETIASCLEQVFMFYWFADTLQREEGKVLPRRGSLHWSDAYAVMNGANGSIMVTPTPDFDSQLAWLIEEGVHDDLIDPKYMQPENLRARISRSMEILQEWVATKDVGALFLEAQERHSPYGRVLPLANVAENPQLKARNWYVPYNIAGQGVSAPGTPYRLSETPWSMGDYKLPEVQEVVTQIGWHTGPNDEATEPFKMRFETSSDKRQRPLEGLKILDFSHVLAGPFATRILADMGADVVKVNSASRALAANNPAHPYYLMWNRNKRALSLNMASAEGRKLCRELCAQADVVLDNFSVGVLDRWGVGYKDVSPENAGVIYVQMSGMGEGGPWSKFVTYAPTIHALAGLTSLTSVPGREDIGIGYSYNDHQAGLHGAVAMLAALVSRQFTGRGQRIDLSQFEVGVNFAGPSLLDYFANERAATAVGNKLPYDIAVPHNVYQCSANTSTDVQDVAAQSWLAIACMTDKQWRSLVELMGAPEWATVAQFDSAAGRKSAEAEIDDYLATWVAGQDAYALMALCQSQGVPAGVVQNGRDLVENDPQLKAAGFVHELQDAGPHGQRWVDTLPIKFDKTPCDSYQRTRGLGEDNEQILRDWLKVDDSTLAQLQQTDTLS